MKTQLIELDFEELDGTHQSGEILIRERTALESAAYQTAMKSIGLDKDRTADNTLPVFLADIPILCSTTNKELSILLNDVERLKNLPSSIFELIADIIHQVNLLSLEDVEAAKKP